MSKSVRVEARVDVLRRLQRSHEERCAHQEHEADRDLRDDERVAEAMAGASAAGAAARFLLERVNRVRPRRLQRGSEAEEHTGHESTAAAAYAIVRPSIRSPKSIGMSVGGAKAMSRP